MSFSLDVLSPKIVDVKLIGTDLVIPVLPLSFAQWQNVTIGLALPKTRMKRVVQDPSKPPVDVPDTDNLDYQREEVEYQNTLKLRRLAIALSGAGAEELQGLSLDEQVAILRDKDAGILNAIYAGLERLAKNRMVAWFRREPGQPGDTEGETSPAQGNGHLQDDGVDT